AARGNDGAGIWNAGRLFPQHPGRADSHPRQLLAARVGSSTPHAGVFRGHKSTSDHEWERAARTGRLDHVADQPTYGAGDRQPRMGVALRRRPGAYAEQLRVAVGAAKASRAARLAGWSVYRGRLVAEKAASEDSALGRISAGQRDSTRRNRLAELVPPKSECSGLAELVGPGSRQSVAGTFQWPTSRSRSDSRC